MEQVKEPTLMASAKNIADNAKKNAMGIGKKCITPMHSLFTDHPCSLINFLQQPCIMLLSEWKQKEVLWGWGDNESNESLFINESTPNLQNIRFPGCDITYGLRDLDAQLGYVLLQFNKRSNLSKGLIKLYKKCL